MTATMDLGLSTLAETVPTAMWGVAGVVVAAGVLVAARQLRPNRSSDEGDLSDDDMTFVTQVVPQNLRPEEQMAFLRENLSWRMGNTP